MSHSIDIGAHLTYNILRNNLKKCIRKRFFRVFVDIYGFRVTRDHVPIQATGGVHDPEYISVFRYESWRRHEHPNAGSANNHRHAAHPCRVSLSEH